MWTRNFRVLDPNGELKADVLAGVKVLNVRAILDDSNLKTTAPEVFVLDVLNYSERPFIVHTTERLTGHPVTLRPFKDGVMRFALAAN